ncbi:MAG: hypothetical protein QNK05_24510 [Myxococcota bacterium]|nr:hypothetical protein [Myxococcota bacterium]
MDLVFALRVAAALLVLAGSIGVFMRGVVVATPFVAAAVLFALSALAPRRPRPIAFLCIGLCIAMPLGVLVSWLGGRVEGAVVLVDAVIFGGLGVAAVQSLRKADA